MAKDIAVNIILGFLIPGIFGFLLYFKDKKVLLIIAPLMGAFAHAFNEFGFHLGFWRYVPIQYNDDLTLLTANLGLYPVLGSYLIYFIRKYKKPYLTTIIFTVATTTVDGIGLLFRLIAYENGWNLGWTFLLTLMVYLVVYWYYKVLEKIQVFN